MPIPHRPIQRRRHRDADSFAGSSSLIAEARSNISLLPSGASAPNRLSGVYIRPRSPMYHPRPAFGGPSPLGSSPLSSPSPSSSLSRLTTAITSKSTSPASEVPIEDLMVPGGGRPIRAGAAQTMGFDLVPDLKSKVTALEEHHEEKEPSEPRSLETKTGFWAWAGRNRGKEDAGELVQQLVQPPTPPLEQDAGDDDWEHVLAEEDDELCIVGELELDDKEDTHDIKREATKITKSGTYAAALAERKAVVIPQL